MTAAAIITLDTLPVGTRGTVVRVAGESAVAQRLGEMGVVAGAAYEIIRFAPLGDPMEIRLDGYHLSIRKSEAHMIAVEVRA